jgi:hypothetical protein
MPNMGSMVHVTKKNGRLPYMSANGDKVNEPMNCPANVTGMSNSGIDESGLMDFSIGVSIDSSITSTESDINDIPTERNIILW